MTPIPVTVELVRVPAVMLNYDRCSEKNILCSLGNGGIGNVDLPESLCSQSTRA
jgi:hypothetical protein